MRYRFNGSKESKKSPNSKLLLPMHGLTFQMLLCNCVNMVTCNLFTVTAPSFVPGSRSLKCAASCSPCINVTVKMNDAPHPGMEAKFQKVTENFSLYN